MNDDSELKLCAECMANKIEPYAVEIISPTGARFIMRALGNDREFWERLNYRVVDLIRRKTLD